MDLKGGVPEGSSVSPMLFKIHVKPLEEVLWKSEVLYDLILRNPISPFPLLWRMLSRCLSGIWLWLQNVLNRLKWNLDKMEIVFLWVSI